MKPNCLKNEKHQTRVSLLLELVSDAYLTANRTRYMWSSTQKTTPLDHASPTTTYIYKKQCNYFSLAFIDVYGGFEKFACILTDGSRAMTVQIHRLVGSLKNRGVHCPTFYYINHQEALRTKLLHISGTMIYVTKVLNIIKGKNRAQRYGKFVESLKDLRGEYEDVPVYFKNSMAKYNENKLLGKNKIYLVWLDTLKV